jgi:plastocyanin
MSPIKHQRAIAAVIGVVGCAVIVPVAASSAAAHKPKVVVKSVSVADDAFAPKKLTIKKGNEINFVWKKTNYDAHNVTLLSGPKGSGTPSSPRSGDDRDSV